MKFTFEELWFLILALHTAHGPADGVRTLFANELRCDPIGRDEHDPVSERRQAADLIDKLGAEAIARYQPPPGFAVSHLSGELRALADRQERLYGV